MSHRKRRWQLATGPIMATVSRIGGIELFHTSIPPRQSFTVSPHQERQFHIGTPPQAVFEVFVYGRICAKSWFTGHYVLSLGDRALVL